MNQGQVLIAVIGIIFLVSWVIGRAQKRQLMREVNRIEQAAEIQ